MYDCMESPSSSMNVFGLSKRPAPTDEEFIQSLLVRFLASFPAALSLERVSAGPIPEYMRREGLEIAPPDNTTLPDEVTEMVVSTPLIRAVTPVAVSPRLSTRITRTPLWRWKLLRLRANWR